ncbi:MAG: DUF1254 domain-containing protein [Roseibium sp.]|uniref:DUF1254 domain-containing protein n=1 Tax=Roseibium sp. TaxID=1936156 RepID=UPI003D9C5307
MPIKQFLAALAVFILPLHAAADNPKMKMTTEIPDGISAPDSVESSIGTLNFKDGVPDQATAKAAYDALDHARAVTAYLNTIQIASMHGMRKGMLEFGPANYTVLAFKELMNSKALFLTPNTSSVYFFMWVDTQDTGPLVIETPPNVLGIIDDYWFHYVADFGNAGPDKGKGGKFLLLPPDFKGEIPDGYQVAQSGTFGNWVLWRGFLKDGDPGPAVEGTEKSFKIYPLGQKETAPKMNFVDVSGKPFNTIHTMDFRYWEEINDVIQAEPGDPLGPEMLGLLAAIGIEKGKDFAPDDRMRAILTDAANIGAAAVRALAARPREDRFYYYPGESYWATPFVGGSYLFNDDNGARILDARAMFHFYATGITPAMTQAPVGAGSQYAMLYLDKNGNQLDGSKTYKITLPKDVPAKNFWSFVVYDNQTRSMLQTDQQFPSVSSAKGKVKQNDDGTYDIYFGPDAPEGMADNWVQTIPGKGWNMLFRLYGPLQPWFDKTWRPGDAVPVEG